MIGELKTLRKLTQMIVDNPMEMEYGTVIKSTLDALPYPIFIIDSLYNIKFANNYLSFYFNINISRIVNKKYTDTLFRNSSFEAEAPLTTGKGVVGMRDPFYIPKMKKFPIFNKNNKTIGYVCVVDIKHHTTSDIEKSVLYANSILSTTTFNSKSIAVQCDWENNLNITEIFSSKSQNNFSWLKGKSYINDITYVSDRQKVESYVETLEKDKNKIWNSRIYNKEKAILPVQQYMSLQNGQLLVHVASNGDGNIEIELS